MEQKMVERASERTVLSWGTLVAPVAMFKTQGDSKLPSFDLEPYTEEEKALLQRGVSEAFGAVVENEEASAVVDAIQDRAVPPEPERSEEDLKLEAILTRKRKRGLQLEDRFVDLDDALAAVDRQTESNEVRIVGFVRVEKVPRVRIKGGYYVGSGGPGAPQLLRALGTAMKATGRVAVVKWTKRTRQALGVMVAMPNQEPWGGTLLVLELSWAEDLRLPNESCRAHMAEEYRPDPATLDAAVNLVAAMSDAVSSLDEYHDDKRRMYLELLDAAARGEDVAVPAEPQRYQAGLVNLADALEESRVRSDEFTAVA